MVLKKYVEKLTTLFSIYYPYFAIFFILAMLLWTIAIGKFNSAIRGLVIGIPAIISCYYSIIFRNECINSERAIHFSSQINISWTYFLYFVVYQFSIYALVLNNTRPWYYFLFISIAYLIIFVQIFSQDGNSKVILIEIFFIMSNLIYSVTLGYKLYFGTTDLLIHMFISQVTYISGHVIPSYLSSYSFFPLYHILISEASYLLGLDIRTSLFLITAPIYSITVIFIYYILLRVIKNQQIALLSCALYSSSYVVLYYGVNVITRTMAFIVFVMILYFAFCCNQEKNNKIYRSLSVLISLFLILVHQVSVPQIVLVLTILRVSEWIAEKKYSISNTYFLLINIGFISYWFLVAFSFVQNDLNPRTQLSNFDSAIILPESIGLIHNEWINTLGLFDDSIFLFFALIAIGYFWIHRKNYASSFGLVAFFTLIFYVQNPLASIWQFLVLFRLDRMALFVSPFMAFVMGFGIYLYLTKVSRMSYKPSKIYFLVVFTLLFVFVSTSLVYSVSDSDDLWINPSHEYFTGQELNSFNYIFNRVPYGYNIYSDSPTSEYFPFKFKDSESLGLPYYHTNIIKNANDIITYKGYVVIREQEFSRNGLYFGVNELEVKGASKYLYTGTQENKEELNSSIKYKNKIYSNSAVSLYLA